MRKHRHRLAGSSRAAISRRLAMPRSRKWKERRFVRGFDRERRRSRSKPLRRISRCHETFEQSVDRHLQAALSEVVRILGLASYGRKWQKTGAQTSISSRSNYTQSQDPGSRTTGLMLRTASEDGVRRWIGSENEARKETPIAAGGSGAKAIKTVAVKEAGRAGRQ